MKDRPTPLEQDVLHLLGSGLDAPEIARRLGVHESTVLWCVGHLVAQYGPEGTEALAASLAQPRAVPAVIRRRSWRPRTVALGVSLLYALSIGLLITSIAVAAAWVVDGVHNGPAATAEPASPTPAESATASVPGAATLDPTATATYTPQSDAPQSAPLASATAAPLATAIASPLSLPSAQLPPIPAPTATPALPLPPLPTVPPLPTPHLP